MRRITFATFGLIMVCSVVLTAAARAEIIALNCVDREGAPAMKLTIDTDSKSIEQTLTGGQPTRLLTSQIMEASVRFYDTSGEARVFRKWDRSNGKLFSEIMEGPKKGISAYWKCKEAN